MSPETLGLAAYQGAFAARIRDPRGFAQPAGVPARRMRVYEELLFNNLEGFLLACFPVTRKLLGKHGWRLVVRRFFAERRCHSPLFRDIPRAFLDWMVGQGGAGHPDLPFLAELMHYEWLELAVSIASGEAEPAAIDAHGDLLAGRPAAHPSARLARYRYPVHRIGPRCKPRAPEGGEHAYLLFRDDTEPAAGRDPVRFIVLNPLSARLWTLLYQHPHTGREALQILAGETQSPQPERFVQAGGELLTQLREQGALLGTWRPQ